MIILYVKLMYFTLEIRFNIYKFKIIFNMRVIITFHKYYSAIEDYITTKTDNY